MLNFTQIENDLKTWIKNVTGLDNGHVISQNDNNPRPIGQYATVRVFDPLQIGHDTNKYESAANDTVDIHYAGLRQIMVGVNIYRGDALEKMAALKASFGRVLTKEYFANKNIGFINTSETRDLSQVVDSNYEERRQTDFFFYISDIDVENIEAITKIAGTGFGEPYLIDSTN